MVNITIIKKSGTIKSLNIRKINIDELYKKVNLNKKENFKCHHFWKWKNNYVSLFGKDSGRAGSENKYDLPPPALPPNKTSLVSLS